MPTVEMIHFYLSLMRAAAREALRMGSATAISLFVLSILLIPFTYIIRYLDARRARNRRPEILAEVVKDKRNMWLSLFALVVLWIGIYGYALLVTNFRLYAPQAKVITEMSQQLNTSSKQLAAAIEENTSLRSQIAKRSAGSGAVVHENTTQSPQIADLPYTWTQLPFKGYNYGQNTATVLVNADVTFGDLAFEVHCNLPCDYTNVGSRVENAPTGLMRKKPEPEVISDTVRVEFQIPSRLYEGDQLTVNFESQDKSKPLKILGFRSMRPNPVFPNAHAPSAGLF